MAKIAVVLPTIRPERFLDWLGQWQPYFVKHQIKLFVIDDSEKGEISLPDLPFDAVVYTRKDYPAFVPSATGSCRSLGFLMAYKEGYDVITLDDDCWPTGDIIQGYLDAQGKKYAVSNYFDVGHTFGLGHYMRGYPYNQRDMDYPLIQYGGWDNVPDLDAITQAELEKSSKVEGFSFDRRVLAIPKGIAFTGCIMNVFIKNEALPMLYQLVMGLERVGYDRSDDIWSGLFAKKICDHLNKPILINGKASIKHIRASNTADNMKKEQGAIELNEKLWSCLELIDFHDSRSVRACYESLAYQLHPSWFGDKGNLIVEGMKSWLLAL